jgi:hypothetical protein
MIGVVGEESDRDELAPSWTGPHSTSGTASIANGSGAILPRGRGRALKRHTIALALILVLAGCAGLDLSAPGINTCNSISDPRAWNDCRSRWQGG